MPLCDLERRGAARRIAMGAGGIMAATVLGIFFTRLFYVATRRWIAGAGAGRGQGSRKEIPSGKEQGRRD